MVRVQDKFAYREMVWRANFMRECMRRARLDLRLPAFRYWGELGLYFPFTLLVAMSGEGEGIMLTYP